jgi:hypothetical protein
MAGRYALDEPNPVGPAPARTRCLRAAWGHPVLWSPDGNPCDDRAVPTLFASYLRVYEPLSAFDKQSQTYWRRYVHDGRAVTPAEGPGRQRTAVLEALGASWSRLPDLPDDAYVMQSDDTTLICPWNLRIRVAEAALEARDGVPPVLADAFVPPILAGLARAVVSDWNSGARVLEHGTPRQHEQISTWSVPLRWFVLVEADDRELVLEPQRRLLRYRTEISKARRRAHRALSVLRRSVGDVPISEAVEESARWLEEFHPRSIVELDYGGLAAVLPDEALSEDDSPALVAAGLAALANGDADSATKAYEQLVERWRAIQLLERCN